MEQSVLFIGKYGESTKEIIEIFRNEKFTVWVKASKREAVKIIKTATPSIILMDTNYGQINGIEFCREIRFYENNWTPLILLTKQDEEIDAVISLELGADDCLPITVNPKLLLAKVKSIIRRGTICCTESGKTEWDDSRKEKVVFAELAIDAKHFTVYKNGVLVNFTRKEYEIFLLLFKNKGTVFSREQLIKGLNDRSITLNNRIIDVFISRIRRKIETVPKNPVYIKTVRQIGYMFSDDAAEQPALELIKLDVY